ncbi:MetS family NSS transporter small subunit [Egicoccus sp. AB-alg6-2]
MSTGAVVLMVLALLLVWGGFAASITFAVMRSRGRRALGGRDT